MKLLTLAKPVKRIRKPRLIGGVIYQGPSMIDGSPIVVIVTGFRKSKNSKTGAMLQTWILRADQTPTEAVKSGADQSICGDCRHRDSSCYVVVAQAPLAVYKAWQAGRYQDWTGAFPDNRLQGRQIRLGAYGDPAAVPFRVWRRVFEQKLAGWTGYTHQWRNPDVQRLRNFVMASVDSPEEQAQASAAGWRTFRVRHAGETLGEREVICPASDEAGNRTTCEACNLCQGQRSDAKSIVITVHGTRAGNFTK